MKISKLTTEQNKNLQREIINKCRGHSRDNKGMSLKINELKPVLTVILHLRDHRVSYANIAKSINESCKALNIELSFTVKPHHVKKILDLQEKQPDPEKNQKNSAD